MINLITHTKENTRKRIRLKFCGTLDCYSQPNSHFSKHGRFIIIFHSIGKYIDLSQKFAFIYDIYPIEQVVLTTSKLFEMNGTYLFHYMTTSLLHSLRSLKTHRLKRALQIDKLFMSVNVFLIMNYWFKLNPRGDIIGLVTLAVVSRSVMQP